MMIIFLILEKNLTLKYMNNKKIGITQRTANENFENSQFLIWGCENNDIFFHN